MIRDVIDFNDFTVLVETSQEDEFSVDACIFDEPIVGVAFYGSGNVNLSVRFGENQKEFDYTKSLALSFYADNEVKFVHIV